ncbi:Hypothetical protein NocV09_09400140 [Nannochloropsis oceanica]
MGVGLESSTSSRRPDEKANAPHQDSADAADVCHDRLRSQSVHSSGSSGSCDGSSPPRRSSLGSTSSKQEAREREGKEKGRGQANSLLGVQGRLTGELIKPPDAHRESLFAPFYASDAAGPPAKKPPSYLASADGGAKEETWWMKDGGGSGGDEEGNMDESLTARLRRHTREVANLKTKEERKVPQRESNGGDGVDRGRRGGVDEIQDEGREKGGRGEQNDKGERDTGLRRAEQGAAMPLLVQHRQQEPVTHSHPEPSPSTLSLAPSLSIPSSNLPKYTITVPSSAIPVPRTHTTIKRYSELLRYHRLWCEQRLVPRSLKAKFPPKTLLPPTMTMGTVRTVGPVGRMDGDGEAGEASSSTLKRAYKLQLYFQALLDLKEEGTEEGRMQGGNLVESPLFWAMFAASGPE